MTRIELTPEDFKKIRELERLFFTLNLEKLSALADESEVVARLQGVDLDRPQILTDLVHSHNSLVNEQIVATSDISRLQGDIVTLKSDMQSLLRTLDRTLFSPNYNVEFNTLKSKYFV